MKTDNLFLRFLNDIQTQVSQNAYTIWFSKLELLSIVNNVVTIKVPMEIHKQMLSVTYGEIIDDAFFAMTGMHYTFKYITEDEVETFVEPVVPEDVIVLKTSSSGILFNSISLNIRTGKNGHS